MLVVVTMSAVSVAACLVTLGRVIGWRRILRYATLIGVGFTLGLAAFLAGTMTGALVAVLGGLMMALVLTVAKRLVSATERATGVVRKPLLALPAGADPSEYDAKGRWIYNLPPYLNEGELA